jgi:hypothetical protein
MTRAQRLFNRHCLVTVAAFIFLLLVMYHMGEARSLKAIGQKALEAVLAATVDLFFSLVKT